MLKLMKYELKKQKFSKLVILFLAALIEAYFLFGLIIDSNSTQGKALGLLLALTFGAIFFVSFEAIITFNTDLKQKCSYMLFLTPTSPYSVVGAKVITSAVTIFLTGMAFLGLFFLNGSILAARYDSIKGFIELIQKVLKEFVNIDARPEIIVLTVAVLLFNWILTLTLAFFSITLSTTFLANKKGKGFVSFVIFIICSLGVGKIADILSHITNGSDTMILLTSCLLEFVFIVITYLGTSWMLDKKISV